MLNFEGRVVLVPGATGSLGAAVTDKFLALGATVAGVARSWKIPDVGRRGDRFLAIRADMTTADGVKLAVNTALERAKRVDFLIQVLGGFAGGPNIGETDDDTWEKMMNMNLRAAFYVMRAVVPGMVRERFGRIVAVGSRAGVEPVAGLSAYCASKAGLVALVKSVAQEVAGSGVTANVVLPSMIDTPENRAADPGADPSRWVKPAAIADLIAYLASDAAADINGATIPIYGGA